MPEFGCSLSDCSVTDDADLAESIVMQAYVQMPLLPRRADGRWVASLKRLGDRELRLVEHVAESPGQAILGVEVFDRCTQSVLDSRDCEEVEEAIVAFRELLSLAGRKVAL